MHHEELQNLYVCLMKYYYSDQIKEDEMGEACNTDGRDEKCIRSFDCKT